MYTGNGVTKKFPIPSGYDGSTVYLIFPTGQNIKMVQDQGYTVSDGNIIFSAAIPAGVVVSFDEPEESLTSESSLKYVVIYKDGHIVEVTEDPAEYLAQTQKLLSDSQKHFQEVKDYAEQAITRLMQLSENLAENFDSKLYEFTTRANERLENTASSLTSQIHNELSAALLQIAGKTQTVESGLQIMELLRNEAKLQSETAAEKTKSELTEKCSEILSTYESMKELKADCKYYLEESKAAAQKAGLEVLAEMNLKANEELEMLKSLRLKLESDSDNLNKRINSAWEVLRGEGNGG